MTVYRRSCADPQRSEQPYYTCSATRLKHGRVSFACTPNPEIFESRYAYVDSVAVSGDGVSFKTHARFDAQPVRVDVSVSPTDGGWRRSFFLDEAHASFKIVCNVQLQPGSYLVEIAVDRSLAYKAISLIEELPF